MCDTSETRKNAFVVQQPPLPGINEFYISLKVKVASSVHEQSSWRSLESPVRQLGLESLVGPLGLITMH